MREENSGNGDFFVKEFGERTLNAGRLYSLLREEAGIEDPWHIMVLALCSFERMHPKDGWEFMLTNREDVEDVGRLFERAGSPEEFREGLIDLKTQGSRDTSGNEDPL